MFFTYMYMFMNSILFVCTFYQDIDISATTCGRGQLVFGDHEGYVHMVDRQFQVSAFKAYMLRVSHIVQMKQHNIIVTIGVKF